MPIRNFIMAVLVALFYLCYFKSIADVVNKINPKHKEFEISVIILKHIFLGITLNILLTLLGLMSFTFGDIFICISLVILFQSF